MASAFDDDWRLTLQMAIGALTESTKTMATVSAETQRLGALFIGHEKLCEAREKADAKSLETMARAVERLAETVQRNAETASTDRAALSKRIAEERTAWHEQREADRKMAEAKAATEKRERTNDRRWMIGTVILAVGTASGFRWLLGY